MDAKLTLKLDKTAIETAKTYAKEHGISVSRMVEEFFLNLKKSKTKSPEDIIREAGLNIDWDNIEIPEEMLNTETGKRTPADADSDQKRWEYLKEKHDL